jgi:O-antigen ligase
MLVVWLLLTATRIAALAAVTGILAIGLLSAVASGNRKVLLASLCVAVGAGTILLPTVLTRTLGTVPTLGELFQLVRNPLLLYNSINWNGRDLLWAILWGAFMASPIVGLGLGSSSAVIRETFPNQGVRVAHNEYMRLATDTGVLGVVLFATAVVLWLLAAVRLSRRGDRSVREYAFPAAAAILAWALIAITDNAFDYYADFTQYIGFLMAGAVVMQRFNEESPIEAASGDH